MNNFYPKNRQQKALVRRLGWKKRTTTLNSSAIHKSMFLYPADKIFIEPCPLSNQSTTLAFRQLETGKEVRVESEVLKIQVKLRNSLLHVQNLPRGSDSIFWKSLFRLFHQLFRNMNSKRLLVKLACYFFHATIVSTLRQSISDIGLRIID